MDQSMSENLFVACRQGDKKSYASLVKKCYRSVFAVCLGMLGNIHDAEDATQEAVLKGFRNIRKLEKTEQFEAWILRIAKNLCIDFLRRKKREKIIHAEQMKSQHGETNENHELWQAIRRLPQELRLPLTMFYFEQKNAKIIAEKLEISHSGACQRIRDARKMLHEILTEGVKK